MLNYNFQPGTEGPHCGLSFSPSVTDWQAGEGVERGKERDIPPTQLLSLSLHSSLSSSLFPSCYQLLYCTIWHLDKAESQSSSDTAAAATFYLLPGTLPSLFWAFSILWYLPKKSYWWEDDRILRRWYFVLIFQNLCYLFAFIFISILSTDKMRCSFLGKCSFVPFFWQVPIFSRPCTSTSATPSRPAASESRRIATHTVKPTHIHGDICDTDVSLMDDMGFWSHTVEIPDYSVLTFPPVCPSFQFLCLTPSVFHTGHVLPCKTQGSGKKCW